MSVKVTRTRHAVPYSRASRAAAPACPGARPMLPDRPDSGGPRHKHAPSGDDHPCSPSPPAPRLEPGVELRPSRPRLKFP
jgi:hypothetical protein